MVKPIFLLGVPASFNMEQINSISEGAKKITDYWVIVYHNNSKEYSFRVIAEKDYEVIELEKLKNELRELATSNR